MKNTTTITLTDDLYIGRGMHKMVYIHPENPSLCIKIPFTKDDIDLKRELRYRKVLSRQNKTLSILPTYYGTINTNHGTGFIFDRVKNFDDTECFSLRSFLNSYRSFHKETKTLEKLLIDFKNLYFSELPITSDIDPGNLMVQKNSDGYTIRIIDNIGSPVLIPLEYYLRYFAKTKANRYWSRFLKWIQKENPHIITNNLIEKLK